jgi:hypothetical protein
MILRLNFLLLSLQFGLVMFLSIPSVQFSSSVPYSVIIVLLISSFLFVIAYFLDFSSIFGNSRFISFKRYGNVVKLSVLLNH